jgi:asparagine synthase (glutamine-hydrolysing)
VTGWSTAAAAGDATSTGGTYARVTAPPRPHTPEKGRLDALRWIRRTRLGDRLWVTVRRRVRGR